MIAITFALPDESRDFRRRWQPTDTLGSGRERCWRGRLAGREVLLAHIGVGLAVAERSTQRMLSAHRPALIICAGYGGGLDPRLRVGDVVIDSRGQAVAAAAEACCAALPGQVFFGAIASQPHALETPAAKAALAHETGALAVDMETAAVARAAAEHGIPLIAVRAISDTAHDPLPVPMAHWFDLQRQRPRPLALLGYLARHWGRIAPFVRFVRGLPKARRALTEAVAHTILHAR